MRPGGFLHAFSFGHLLTYTLTTYIRERGKNITFKIRKGLKKKNRKIEKKRRRKYQWGLRSLEVSGNGSGMKSHGVVQQQQQFQL